MTLLLREVARFSFDAVLWIGALVAVTALVATPVMALRRLEHPTRVIGSALISAAVLVSVVHRLSLPMAWSPHIGSRALPVGWAAVGAAAAVAAYAYRQSRAVIPA